MWGYPVYLDPIALHFLHLESFFYFRPERSLWSRGCSGLFHFSGEQRLSRCASILEEKGAFKRSYCLYFGAGRNLWNILQERSLWSSSCSFLVEEDGMLLSILEDRQTERER